VLQSHQWFGHHGQVHQNSQPALQRYTSEFHSKGGIVRLQRDFAIVLIGFRLVSQVYLARVKGRFPAGLQGLAALSRDQLTAPTESAEVQKEFARDCTEADGSGGDAGCEDEDEGTRKRRRKGGNGEEAGTATKRPRDPACDSGTGTVKSEDEKEQSEPVATSEECIGYGFDNDSGDLVVRCPIAVVSHREGIHACDLSGKPALSSFR
jgi:hypothetical protein